CAAISRGVPLMDRRMVAIAFASMARKGDLKQFRARRPAPPAPFTRSMAGILFCARSADHNKRLSAASGEAERTFHQQRGATMKRFIAAAVVVAIVGLAAPATGADATGTWKWTATFNGQTRDSTLKLKQEGDKLTGVYVGGQSNTETPIEDGKISG